MTAVVERGLAVADANRFLPPGASASVMIIDSVAALARQPAVLGTIATGLFPRAIAPVGDGNTLLVTNYDSFNLQVVDLDHGR